MSAVRNYAIVTASYWGFTLTGCLWVVRVQIARAGNNGAVSSEPDTSQSAAL